MAGLKVNVNVEGLEMFQDLLSELKTLAKKYPEVRESLERILKKQEDRKNAKNN